MKKNMKAPAAIRFVIPILMSILFMSGCSKISDKIEDNIEYSLKSIDIRKINFPVNIRSYLGASRPQIGVELGFTIELTNDNPVDITVETILCEVYISDVLIGYTETVESIELSANGGQGDAEFILDFTSTEIVESGLTSFENKSLKLEISGLVITKSVAGTVEIPFSLIERHVEF